MFIASLHTTLLLVLLPSLTTAAASCECGYTLNGTLYTSALETDFLHLPSFTNSPDWQPQNYTVTAASARGPYGKNASLDNVRANPLKSQWDWAGEGVEGGDAGLQLWVRGGVPRDGLVGMAEVASVRGDMLFGTFRVGMKVTGVEGTCGAFFWYYNDTQEIDLEFLSHTYTPTLHPLNLVLQSPASASRNFNAANTSTFTPYPLPFDPTSSFHEYRFDWSPNSVSFYADGVLLNAMTTAVPTMGGHVTLSHWSTGNKEWSAGPPDVDAVVTVEYVKAYFNSSDEERKREWEDGCKDPRAVNATCAIPEVMEAPDGNVSAKTVFLTQQPGIGTQNHTKGARKKSEGVSVEGAWGPGWTWSLIMMVVFIVMEVALR